MGSIERLVTLREGAKPGIPKLEVQKIEQNSVHFTILVSEILITPVIFTQNDFMVQASFPVTKYFGQQQKCFELNFVNPLFLGSSKLWFESYTELPENV